MSKRYYYINIEGKIIQHYAAKQEIEPQGFEFAGMSELPVITAATFYARSQQGYKLLDGDKIIPPEPVKEDPEVPEEPTTQEAAE